MIASALDVLTALGDMVKRGILRLPAAVAALATIGMTAGVAVYIVVPGGEEEVSPDTVNGELGACIPHDLASPALTPAKGEVLVDPEAGLSERDALHRRLWDEFVTRYTAWVKCVDISKLDLRSLPRRELNTSWLPGQPSLPDAVAKANLIIVATVTEFSPTPFSGTNTALEIDKTLKGSPASTVTIGQDGGVRPTEDWTGVTISEAGNRAMLLPGDRAVLLLQQDGNGGYYIQGVSGWFQIVNGVVRANSYNDWGPSVEGKTGGGIRRDDQGRLKRRGSGLALELALPEAEGLLDFDLAGHLRRVEVAAEVVGSGLRMHR